VPFYTALGRFALDVFTVSHDDTGRFLPFFAFVKCHLSKSAASVTNIVKV